MWVTLMELQEKYFYIYSGAGEICECLKDASMYNICIDIFCKNHTA